MNNSRWHGLVVKIDALSEVRGGRGSRDPPEARRLATRGDLRAPLLRRAEQRHPAEFAALRRHGSRRA